MSFMQIVILVCVLGCTSGLATAKVTWKEGQQDRPGCRETFRGCRLVDGACVCGVETACTDPFPYLNMRQCEKELDGELDKCLEEPCESGECVQLKTDRGFRSWECRCAGSGYYGKRCDIPCPRLSKADEIPELYPIDCIY